MLKEPFVDSVHDLVTDFLYLNINKLVISRLSLRVIFDRKLHREVALS